MLRLPLFLSLTVSCSVLMAQQVPPGVSGLPHYERVPCTQSFSAEDRAECGLLTVRENRSHPQSRFIRLPVVIFHGPANSPRDAVLFMTGGPGLSSVANLHSARDNIFVLDRDYVVLEQRGARRAQPSLECPELAGPKTEIHAGRLRGVEARQVLAQAARACRTRLVSEGADLSGYTTAATAADIEDLRKAFGYERWDLYGISYSTRLMLTYARDYPSGVRSMLLDSVLPLEVNFEEMSASNLIRSLDQVFDQCAVTPACVRDNGDVRRKFFELVKRAEKNPLPLAIAPADAGGKPARIQGAEVVNAIYSGLHSVRTIPELPAIIAEAYDGKYDRLTPLAKSTLGDGSAFSWGLRYSIWCSEEFPFENRKLIEQQVSPEFGFGGADLGTLPPEVCDAWNVPPSKALENQPVTSDAPTLIFAGEFDPDTPPLWGQQLLGSLTHAYFLEFRGRSHTGGFFRCGQEMAAEFFRHPEKTPSMDCALGLRGADFGSTVPKN